MSLVYCETVVLLINGNPSFLIRESTICTYVAESVAQPIEIETERGKGRRKATILTEDSRPLPGKLSSRRKYTLSPLGPALSPWVSWEA